MNTKNRFYVLSVLAALICGIVLISGAVMVTAQSTESNSLVYLPFAVGQTNNAVDPVVSPTATPTSTPETVTPPTGNDCPTDLFLDVDQYAGPGGSYADPNLSATCQNGQLVVQSNGMPTFEFVQITPNDLSAQNYTWSIPLEPDLAAQTTALALGTVGFAVDGLPIYGPYEAPQHGTKDPYVDGILDTCNGHTGPRGEYHYHATMGCNIDTTSVETVIGFALDGFPIYGNNGCLDAACTQVTSFQSSYELKPGYTATDNVLDAYEYVAGQGETYLDECNGRIRPDGSYGYYATSEWPYLIGCYRGEVGGGGAATATNTDAGASTVTSADAGQPVQQSALPTDSNQAAATTRPQRPGPGGQTRRAP